MIVRVSKRGMDSDFLHRLDTPAQRFDKDDARPVVSPQWTMGLSNRNFQHKPALEDTGRQRATGSGSVRWRSYSAAVKRRAVHDVREDGEES